VLLEHKQCGNTATNASSENAISIIVASSGGKREYGGKEDELSTARVLAAGFQYVTSRSLLGRVFNL
jgi:hypothetical protein